MALGNVFITDTDGRLPSATSTSNEKITGLLFDVSKQPELFTAGYGKSNESKLKLGDVCYITSRAQAIKDYGIIERVECDEGDEATKNFMFGIPNYHISEFFRMSGNIDGYGKLYVMFADCSSNWDAIEIMQRASGGTISQLGIWTEQPLWKKSEETYLLNIVKTINDKAELLATQNQPLSLVLSASCANTGTDDSDGKKVDLNKIPTCICDSSRTSVIIGQARNELISTMQMRNKNCTPVGFLGSVMGCIAKANVQESIAWGAAVSIFLEIISKTLNWDSEI